METDILQLTQEALELANTAVHFDTVENYVGAYDYYDKSILNLDEVIAKIPPTTTQWGKLMDIRNQYNDRMDALKEMERGRSFLGFNKGGNFSSTTTTGENNPSTAADGSSSSQGQNNKKDKSSKSSAPDEFQFSEMDVFVDCRQYDDPPTVFNEIPFWQLKNIARSILDNRGCFLSRALFIPKQIWHQSDVKFSGFSARAAALDFIYQLLINDIAELYFSYDEDSLYIAENTFDNIEQELLVLRNQLSKSFPYIKEATSASVSIGVGIGSAHDYLTPTSSSHPADPAQDNNNNSPTGGGSGSSPNSPLPSANYNTSSVTTAVPTTTATTSTTVVTANPSSSSMENQQHSSASAIQSSLVSTSSKNNKSLTGIVTAFGKSMKKIAEVGLHRLAVALPTRLTNDLLQEYATKIVKLCEKSQMIVQWMKYIEGLKNGVALQNLPAAVPLFDPSVSSSLSTTTNTSSSSPPKSLLSPTSLQLLSKKVELTSLAKERIHVIGTSLNNISLAFRDIVCEILLRDVEYLLDRYLHHTRKTYTRMQWDQDHSTAVDN